MPEIARRTADSPEPHAQALATQRTFTFAATGAIIGVAATRQISLIHRCAFLDASRVGRGESA